MKTYWIASNQPELTYQIPNLGHEYNHNELT
jgi:hypothetical protein